MIALPEDACAVGWFRPGAPFSLAHGYGSNPHQCVLPGGHDDDRPHRCRCGKSPRP